MKRISMLLMVLIFVLGIQTVYATTDTIKIVVDGKTISSDVAPVLDTSSGRVLAPMRPIFEALGYKVSYDERQKKAIAQFETPTSSIGAYVQFEFGVLTVQYSDWKTAQDKVNGNSFYNDFYFDLPLDSKNPVKIIDGRTMLPTRIIAESLGAKVDWDGTTKTVFIDTQGSKIVAPKGWEKAISDFYKVVSPDYLYIPNTDFDGAYDSLFTFNGVKGGNVVATQPTSPTPVDTTKQTRTPVIIIGKDKLEKDLTPVDTANGTIYKVYDYFKGKVIEYSYKNPTAIPPVVDSFPAKILINENIKTVSYYIDPSKDPNDYTNWATNLTPSYRESGMSLGGCNWYADSRFWEVTGIPFPHFRESESKEFWKTNEYLDTADKYNELLALRDVNDVQSNSIALRTSDDGKNSHVEYVEYVERDINGKPINVYVTEANVNGNGMYRYGIDGKVTKESFAHFQNSGNLSYRGCIIANPDFYK